MPRYTAPASPLIHRIYRIAKFSRGCHRIATSRGVRARLILPPEGGSHTSPAEATHPRYKGPVMRSWLPPSGGRTRPGGGLRPPQFSIDLPPDPDRQTRQRLDVGPRRPEIDDARAQDVAAVDDRVRDERLAAALQAVEQPAVQRVEVL